MLVDNERGLPADTRALTSHEGLASDLARPRGGQAVLPEGRCHVPWCAGGVDFRNLQFQGVARAPGATWGGDHAAVFRPHPVAGGRLSHGQVRQRRSVRLTG